MVSQCADNGTFATRFMSREKESASLSKPASRAKPNASTQKVKTVASFPTGESLQAVAAFP